MKAPEGAARHRLFRAMVLMGGSLAVGCGGIAAHDEQPSSGSAGSGGGAGAGGTGSTGLSGGGTGSSAALTDAAVVPLAEAGVLPCVPAQWQCPFWSPCGPSQQGWQLPTGCTCDLNRPRLAADCGTGEILACRVATAGSSGEPLATVVPFECACVPQRSYCNAACEDLFGPNGAATAQCDEVTDGTGSPYILCGCAVVYLK
ncbi:MAG TPA: hypothetical protein VF881_03640 [Polyangiaceae bacterium]